MRDKDIRRLIPIQEHKFEQEPVRQCYLTKLFQFCEVRNAWGSFSSDVFRLREPNLQSRYPGDTSFSIDLSGAQACVEKQRTKGSKWVIHELPVVAIGGPFTCLLVGEINSFNPLSSFVPLKGKLLTLRDCARFFSPRSPNSVIQFLYADSANPAMLPFYTHASESHGGSQPLTWKRDFGMDDLTAVLHIICHITERVQRQAEKSFLAAAGITSA